MFYTLISKDTFDQVMTLFFKNLGLVEPNADLIIKQLSFEDEVVVIEADVKEETLQ